MAPSAFSLIMPTVDWGPTFSRCAQAAVASLRPSDQLIVVFDGQPDPAPAWLTASGATLLQTGARGGPAGARNLAASAARNPILFFVDADVELHPDALERARAHFDADEHLQALFGSYDANPAAPGLVSRFRNLLHHHTHHAHPGPACTFWAGCGAVRRDAFLALAGFDAQAYRQPCIEDIEFGLRLWEAGGFILLEPAIQGTHHKRWTLPLMLRTDIQQRAIPWSQLLLRRNTVPATLNLSPAARWSAAGCLVAAACLLGLALPALRPWSLLGGGAALLLVGWLNRSFLALLHRQGGLPLLGVGAALHGLYQLYSSLTFVAVLLAESMGAPLRLPSWLRRSPTLTALLTGTGLSLLGLLALAALGKGVDLLFHPTGRIDLLERYEEWLLFRDHIFPSWRLATPEQRALPYFRTTAYLPWALPLFPVLFAGGGLAQGKLLLLLGSLASLGLMAWLGWRVLRPWGRAAGLLGLLTPLAINGNASCLAHGQFSLVCMGLLTTQWLLLRRQRPLPAGLCWALAMVKPQIAATYAVPFFRRGQSSGLWLGSGLLLGLSAVTFLQTRTSPGKFLLNWLSMVPKFINKGNSNALGKLILLFQNNPGFVFLFCLALIASIAMTIHYYRNQIRPTLAHLQERLLSSDWLTLAGFLGLLGMIGFYHTHLDTIMIFPAVLACWKEGFRRPTRGTVLLALLLAASAWTPESLLHSLPGGKTIQFGIWLLVALSLLARCLTSSAPSSSPAFATIPSNQMA